MTSDPVSIASESLRAPVSSLGAELGRLQTVTGEELLWDGNPAVWAGRSPLLFPIVGAVKDDRVKVRGQSYPLARHGFARTSPCELVASESARCTWRLRANDDTRSRYPFAFRLDVTYALAANRLPISATVANEGDDPMPVSFGFHPAFRWPLVAGVPREHHEIRFEKPEPAPVRSLTHGLLGAPVASPVSHDRLALSDALFAHDAVVFDRLQS